MLLPNPLRKTLSLRALALGTTCIAALSAAPAAAQVVWEGDDGTWETGGGTELWDDGGTAVDFGDGDDAVFNDAGETATVAAPVTAGDVTFNADGVTINGDDLTINGTVEVTNGGETATLDAGVTGDLTVSGAGTLNVAGGADGTVTNDGPGGVDVSSTAGALDSNGGTTNVIGGGDITGTTTIDNSTVVVNGGQLSGQTTVNSGGILDVDNGSTGAVVNAGGDVELDTPGTIGSLTQNSGTATINGTLGTLDSNGDTVNVIGDGNVTGTTTIDNSEVVVNGGQLSGQTTVNGGGILDVDNGSTGAVVNAGGDVELDAPGTIDSLTQNSGTATINGTLGTLDSNGDTVNVIGDGNVTGTTTIDNSEVVVNGGQLSGQTTVNGGGILDVDNGSTGAVVNAGGDVELDAPGTIGSLIQNSGTATINGTVTGDLTVNAGTLNFTGAVDGTFTNGITFLFDDGTLNDVINDGTFELDGTSSSIVGDFDNNGTLDASNVGAAATLTVGGTNDIFTNAGNITTDGSNAVTITASEIVLDDGSLFNGDANLSNDVVLDGAILNNTTSGITSDYTLLDQLTNQETFNVGAVLNADGNAINNTGAGTQFTVGLGGSIINGGALTNDDGASFTIDAGQSATFSGVTNSDTNTTLTVNGTLDVTGAAPLDNNVGATLTVGADGDVNSDVDNTGIVALNGGDIDALDNNGNGSVTSNGTSTINGTLTNEGTVNVATSTLTVTASVTNEDDGQLTIGDLATLDASSVQNQSGGTLSLNGTLNGTFVNQSGGVVNTGSAASSATNGMTNAGTLNVLNGNTFTSAVTNTGSAVVNGTLVGDLTNNGGDVSLSDAAGQITGALTSSGGTVDVGGGETLTVTALTSITGGSLDNAGTFSGDLTVGPAGTLTSTGGSIFNTTAAAGLINNGSSNFAVNGTVNGNVTTSTGTTNLNGTLNGNLFHNSGVTNFDADVGAAVGQGVINIGNGTVNMDNGATVNGIVQTGGTLSAQDGATGDVINVTGDAVLNGTYAIDIDLTEGQPASADVLAVSGDLSGSIVIDLNEVSGDTRQETPFDLITYGGTSSLVVDGWTPAPAFSPYDYFIADNDAGAIQLESTISTGISGLAASVGLIQTIGNAIVNRPTSPYVSDLATDFGDDPCGPGGWTRFATGSAEASGRFTDEFTDTTGSSPLTLDYQSLQLGSDLVCFDDRFMGDDMSFGAILGVNTGSARNEINRLDSERNTTGEILSVTTTDFEQTYAGAYLTASRGRMFADLQVRFEQTDYTADNNGEGSNDIGVDNEEFTTTGTTFSGSAGYSWNIPQIESLNFIGSFGLSYSEYETDVINAGDSTIQINDATQELGFLSGTVSHLSILPDNISFMNYFATATLYQDFAPEPTALFTSDGEETPITLSNIESYGELSLGLNYVRLLDPAGRATVPRQFNAAVRVDGRQAEDLDSWGITGQMRIQF